jgi:elongation factor 1 alpha-like protein
MATALPIARAQLKDLKPPLSDAAIQDSLWHYWFDVEKAVSWLRKDWEKKGESDSSMSTSTRAALSSPPVSPSPPLSAWAERSGAAGPPPELVPTPDQQTRPRKKKDKPTTTLSALQRLSLVRKAAPAAPAPARPSAVVATPASTSAPVPAHAENQPMSKLALLAQKRRNAAATPEAPASSASASASPTPPTSPAPAAKPLSKLAQKMAAARAAREAASCTPSAPATPAEPDVPEPQVVDECWSFAPNTSTTTSKSSAPATSFFNILTTHTPGAALPEPPSLADMHIAVRDRELAGRRVRDAFGPGVESPDDIVLRKRDGRAGTGATGAATGAGAPTETKPVAEVRAKGEAKPTEVKSKVKSEPNPSAKSKSDKPSVEGKSAPNKSKSAAQNGKSAAKPRPAQNEATPNPKPTKTTKPKPTPTPATDTTTTKRRGQ